MRRKRGMHDRTRHRPITLGACLVLAAILLIPLLRGHQPRLAAPSAALPAQQIAAGETPSGLSASDWQGLQRAVAAATYQIDRLAPDAGQPASGVAPTGAIYQAENQRQGWQTRFAASGVTVAPSAGQGWSWGLAPLSYGYGD